MIRIKSKLPKIVFIAIFMVAQFPLPANALKGAVLLIYPQSATFVEGSTFDVSVFIDTGEYNVNEIKIDLQFSPRLIQAVEVGGKSIVSSWHSFPQLSNTSGQLSFTGSISPSLKTSRGLVTTIKFRARLSGQIDIAILDSSRVMAEEADGNILVATQRANLDALPPLSNGPMVSSATHTDPESFYKNNNAVLVWEQNPDVSGYSYTFNSNPYDIPDNTADTELQTAYFEDLNSGIWYFHLKQNKAGVWSETTHFPVRIDTISPRSFVPKLETPKLAAIGSRRGIISFDTTDSHSGIDHYEIGVIYDDTVGAIPVFLEAVSPYPLPDSNGGNMTVIVRAFDRAGNIQDSTMQLNFGLFSILKEYWVWLIAVLALLGAGGFYEIRRRHARQSIAYQAFKQSHDV
ncbi:MAG: hypothetical protein Q8P35_02260 [Candidatus Yanofskybacteria bacterium]|nr:hypothetical protein [Candidatus Yanofskybacteria bacterium]